MATPRSPLLWVTLAGVALLLIAATALLLISHPGNAGAPAPATGTCPAVAQAAVPPARPEQEASPVVLWGVSPVRLYVDGQAAFSPPEEPKRFAVGLHTLRAEARGEEAVETRFRVEPFTAGLIHAQLVPGIGISVVRLGAGCGGCAFAESPPSIDPEPARFPVPALFTRAATLLRRDQYTTAADALAQIPPTHRRTVAFTRLASAMYADAAQPEAARQLLEAAPPKEIGELKGLLKSLDAIAAREQARKGQVVVDRWNRITERFATLVSRFQGDAPAATAAAAHRMEALSVAFEEAARHRDGQAQARAQEGVQTVLASFAAELRQARAGDCAFQAELDAVLRP